MTKNQEKVSVIVVHYGSPRLLWNFLASVEHHPDKRLVEEVIVVNNELALDKENRVKLEKKRHSIKIVDNPQKGYASGVNRGALAAKGDILVIANNDIEWQPEPLVKPLIDYFRRDSRIGIIGPQLIYPNGSWQRSYGRFPSLKEAIVSLLMLDSMWNMINIITFRLNFSIKKPKFVDYVDGAFMVIKRSCFDEVGGFDESYTFYGEDVDFCWRAWKRGWKVAFNPNVRIIHLRGASSTALALQDYAIRLFLAKKRFVQVNFGEEQAKWYVRLMHVAALERYVLYSLVAKLTNSVLWHRRALRARALYKAFADEID